MSDQFDAEYLEVGDTFVGGPIEQSYFIGVVMAAGGEVDIHGDTVYIVQLPKKNSSNQSAGSFEAKAPVSESAVEKAPEPKVEEAKAEESKVEAPLVDLAHEEPVVEESKTEEPKTYNKPGPKPKAPEVKEED